MEYLILLFDTILLFLSPLKQVQFDPKFVHGMIIVIILSFFIILIKPTQYFLRQFDSSGKWDSVVIPFAVLCFAYCGANLSESDNPIKDFSLFLIVPVIFVRILDGIGASHGVLSIIYDFEASEMFLPALLAFLYFGFVYDFGGFEGLDTFQHFLVLIHFMMLFLTLVGVKQIAKNISSEFGIETLYLPFYFTAAAAIFLSCFINFEILKDESIIGYIFYYIFLFSYLLGVALSPVLKRI